MAGGPEDVHLFPWVISMMRTWETQPKEVKVADKESLENKIDSVHRWLRDESERLHDRYRCLDQKLDVVLRAGGSSKLTPVYALILLAVTFWAGCQVGGL